MRNLLSFQDNVFPGSEIREWAEFHVANSTSLAYLARRVLRNKIIDDRTYQLLTAHRAAGYHNGAGSRSPGVELRRV